MGIGYNREILPFCALIKYAQQKCSQFLYEGLSLGPLGLITQANVCIAISLIFNLVDGQQTVYHHGIDTILVDKVINRISLMSPLKCNTWLGIANTSFIAHKSFGNTRQNHCLNHYIFCVIFYKNTLAMVVKHVI